MRRVCSQLSLAIVVLLLVLSPALASVRRADAQRAGDCTIADAERPLGPNETRMLEKLNRDRAEQGLADFTLSPPLLQAARWKAAALAAGGARQVSAADHDDPFRTWEQRILDCGYPASAFFAENLGIVSNEPAASAPPTTDTEDPAPSRDEAEEALVEQWQEIPLDAGNLLSPRWQYVGVARVRVETTSFWVLVLGSDPG